jgi:hypothetical protein
MTNQVISPEEFFGFQLGSDRKIARWDRIVEYFQKLQQQSDKIKVVDMGPSTEGNPFLLVIVSSAGNLENLDRLKEVNAKISDPRGLSEEEVKELIGEGRAVICQSMSLHATEIGGTQMAPELAYDLLTKTDEETQRILDNVIFLMIPCFNPDGQIMVTDWYNKWLNTEYEGCDLPWLYHKYVGHDNNRDAFMTNMVESQYAAEIMYQEWHPQAYQDHHHMGSYGARLYIAPYCEPIHPHGDPLIWREHSWYGAHMAYKLEEVGKTGILNAAIFAGWAHMGFHWLGIYHNISSMLTESANAKLATPLYIHPEQLKGRGYGNLVGTQLFPHYKPQTTFPHPWPGGWWRLRDIVEQQKVSSWAMLDMAARNKETVLWNAYLKAKRQTESGANGKSFAYVIPTKQHDPLTVELLIEKLLVQGLEIYRATKGFTVDGFTYPAGTYIIFPAQPKMGVIKTLLEQIFYPDDVWTRRQDGSPYRPYDTATDTMSEFMGVHVDPIKTKFDGEFEIVTGYEKPVGKVLGESDIGYVFDSRLNDSFKAMNLLLTESVSVQRVNKEIDVGGVVYPPGAFVAAAGLDATLEKVAGGTGVDFYALEEEIEASEVKRLRVGMYQRYWGGNIDEGWTRFVLEQFGFPYTTLMDDDIKRGGLGDRFDIIILPNDPPGLITGGKELEEWWKENRPYFPFPVFPPEYRSGIGEEGVEAIKEFVEKGGTLVTLGEACDFAIEKLEMKVRNVVKGLEPKEFYCPGSTLKVRVDTSHPLAYGMPEDALVLLWSAHAFEVLPHRFNEHYEVVVKYPERDILQSGWLIGEEKIANTYAMISAKFGEGKVILIGFRTQHRCQTYGTFKLLFNSLLG